MVTKIKKIGHLERLMSESIDLYMPEKAEKYAQALLEDIETRIGLENIKVFSFDVFDTLLLRNQKYELFRYLEISKLVHELLINKEIHHLSIWEIYAARLSAFRICYRTVSHTHRIREGKLLDVLSLMGKILGLEVWIVPELLRIELTYEQDNLSINPWLDIFLRYPKIQSKDIVFISDMYMQEDWIYQLVRRCYPSLEIFRYYSSANYGLTKTSGLLYDLVVDELQVSRSEIVHMGDNFRADVQSAKERGLRAIHLPIPENILQQRKQNKQHFKTELITQGFDLSLVY